MIFILIFVYILQVLSTSPSNEEALFEYPEVDRCTTIVVGAKAGSDGPMCTHTADCLDCDFRLSKVPAMDFEEGLLRPLYLYRGQYPATVSYNRGTTWHPSNLEGTPEQVQAWGQESTIVGHIPQVKHTYALYESGYGIMNEHQVAIGESTCASKFWAAPVTAGGFARIEVREMSKIALERCTTARDAVQMMGNLATEYGFYAADWSGGDSSKGEGGEALTVVDKKEAWVFHVLADDTGKSAVWVAQRLDPAHVAVVANQFIIKEVDPASDKFLYSANLWEVAERNGLWSKEKGLLNFLCTYSPRRAHPTYTIRRVWRVLSLVAPSLQLPAVTDPYMLDYPFSVKAERVLTPQDLMDIQRDHYEGTPFDLTKGVAAGPYGDPNRFDVAPQPADNLTLVDVIQGSYERSISLFRTSYSFVAVCREVPDHLALLWFSQYAPSSSSYAPFYVAAEFVPVPYSRGSLYKYDSSVSFWNFLAAGNYAARCYKYAMKEVQALQVQLMASSVSALASTESRVLSLLQEDPYSPASNEAVIRLLTQFTNKQATEIVSAWRGLLPQLITKFHDGYIAEHLDTPSLVMKRLFYPKWWLDLTGYWKNAAVIGPDVILFDSNPAGSEATYSYGAMCTAVLVTAMTSIALTALAGSYFVRFRDREPKLSLNSRKFGYVAIHNV
mmetsp:Transcript_4731/g.6492  ORF Transcript_4731/g.6492 Transcript_4731/m.6492 type:complete len:670 (+) Transcript_4731:1-2010(+)